MSLWIEKATSVIFEHSLEKQDFQRALDEWRFVGMEDNFEANETCQLCDHYPIKYKYYIHNSSSGYEMFVGSECINKFSENDLSLLDQNNTVVSRNTLSDSMKKTFKNSLLKYLENYGTANPEFDISIPVNLLQQYDGILSTRQVMFFKKPYDVANTEEKELFHKCLKLNFRKSKSKLDFGVVKKEELWKFNFIKKFLSTDQKKRYM